MQEMISNVDVQQIRPQVEGQNTEQEQLIQLGNEIEEHHKLMTTKSG